MIDTLLFSWWIVDDLIHMLADWMICFTLFDCVYECYIDLLSDLIDEYIV